MSWLSTFGKDFAKVFTFIGSPQAQAVVKAGENIAEIADPALTGPINIINGWTTEALKVEALSAAAGKQTGSGAQKAAAVLAIAVPDIISYGAANKATIPDSAAITEYNNALIAFLNQFGAPGSATNPAPTTPPTS